MKNEEFKKLCMRFRELKIDSDKIDKEMSEISKQIKEYSQQNDVKGDLNGLKITHRLIFAKKENEEIAKQNNIELPKKTDIDYSALKKIFEEKGIEGAYELNIAIGLSTKE